MTRCGSASTRVPARAAGDHLAGLGVLPAGVRPAHERMLKRFIVPRDRACWSPASLFGYYLALPAAAHFLTNYDTSQLPRPDPRAYIGFASKVLARDGVVFELPLFVIGLTRIGILTTRKLRATAASATSSSAASESRCRASTRSRPMWRRCRCSSSTRGRSGSRCCSSARRARGEAARRSARDGGLRRLGAARRRAADRGRARSLRGRRDRRGRRPAARSGTTREAAIVPGFVNAHSHLEYAVYAGFGDGQAFGPWIATHVERERAARADGHGRDRAPRRRRVTALGDRDDRGLQLLRRGGDRRGGAGAARDRLPRGVRGRSRGGRAAVRQEARSRSGDRLVRIGISPHAPYTCSLDDLPVVPVARHTGRHASRRERERERVARAGSGPLSASILVPPTGKRAVATLEPVLGPDLLCAHCVEVKAEEIALLAERNVPVAHCPRSNALLGCGIAPIDELRAADVRVGLGTDSPASTPSFDMFEEMRTAIDMARARAQRPEALLATDALQMATSTRPGRCGSRSGGYPDARQASRSDGRVARGKPVPSGRGSRSGSRLRRLAGTSARDNRRRPHPLRKRGQRNSGERYAAPQAPPDSGMLAARCRSSASAQAEAAAVAGGALLPAPARAREVGVRAARRGLRRRVRLLRRRLRFNRDQRRAPERLQLRQRAAARRSRSSRTRPTSTRTIATGVARSRNRARAEAAHTGGRDGPRALHDAAPEGPGALAELASQYGTLATNYSNDYAVAQQQMAEQESPASAFGPPSTTPFGKALASSTALKDPISAAVATLAAAKQQTAYSGYQSAQRNAENAYQRLVGLNPKDATSQIQLGQAAQAARTRPPRSRHSRRSSSWRRPTRSLPRSGKR